MIVASATSVILAWKIPLAIIFLILLLIRAIMTIPDQWTDYDYLIEGVVELAIICIALFYGAVY